MALYFSIMDLTDPTRSITGTHWTDPYWPCSRRLGGPVTVGEVAAQSARGIGNRREGVASPASPSGEGAGLESPPRWAGTVSTSSTEITSLLPSRTCSPGSDSSSGSVYVRRFVSWKPPPLYACAFGSAARGDGTSDSDIDLLLVHAPFPGDERPLEENRTAPPKRSSASRPSWPRSLSPSARSRSGIAKSTTFVHSCTHGTGNPLQVVDMSAFERGDHRRRTTELFLETPT